LTSDSHLKLAYILNTYPHPSQSFIRREVQALERGGAEVHRLAMRPSGSQLVDPGDQDEASRTTYVLQQGAVRLLAGLCAVALRKPAAFWSALRLALNMGRASQSGILRHLIYLAEAATVAQYCTQNGIAHMHAHFGTNATAVALLANALGAPGYSFTTHGPEEFDAPHTLSLGLKLDRAAFAVGVSQFGRSQLCRWASFDTWDRIKVVHCGIEPGLFKTTIPGPQGSLRLVSIGRFVEQKGQMVLINALARIRQQIPDIHLSLVGDGEMRPDLEQAITDLGLRDNVHLTGWLDEQGVRRELSSAHALVMPSFAEGLPMVVMEAMAAARPVVATCIAGIPELVLPGKTGWLVPAGDAMALSAAITDLARASHSQLEVIGQTARERVLERHDASHEAARLARLFERAIARTL
jgi:glycosyltransferase involved in cell wall biosynthesis